VSVVGPDVRSTVSSDHEVVDKVRHVKDIQLADFQFLRGATKRTRGHHTVATMLHFRASRRYQQQALPGLEQFYQDVADAYGAELRSLAAAGCTSVQMDDTNLAYLCDEGMREAAKKRAMTERAPHRYASFVNRVVAQSPPG